MQRDVTDERLRLAKKAIAHFAPLLGEKLFCGVADAAGLGDYYHINEMGQLTMYQMEDLDVVMFAAALAAYAEADSSVTR